MVATERSRSTGTDSPQIFVTTELYVTLDPVTIVRKIRGCIMRVDPINFEAAKTDSLSVVDV